MTASNSENSRFTARDGVSVAYSEWGAGDPLVVLVHATGFCKEVCRPVFDDAQAAGASFRAIAIDQRAHGDSGVPSSPFDWWDVARDIVEVVGETRPVVGVGHSSGGAVLAMAEIIQPGTFSSLVLVEPILFPPPYGRYPDNPMSTGALRRKPGFTSKRAAYDNYMSKTAFAGWEPRAMSAYVSGGFRDEGDGVVLKCSPESEAEFFTAATAHGAWDRLSEVEPPVLMLAGAESTTHQEEFLEHLADQFRNARSHVVAETSHFVWMENPGAIAECLVAELAHLQ